MKTFSFTLLLTFIITFSACTRKAAEKTVLKIKMPEKIMSSKSVSIKESTSLWGVQAPSAVGAADCFAVYATQPDLNNSTCTASTGEAVVSVNKFAGMVSAGSNIEIELTPGKSREIGVIAFKSASGTCQGMMDGNLAANYSAPMIVGKATMDLASGTTEVSIPVTTTNAKTFESCSGEPLSSWPVRSCTPSIAKMVSTGGGELLVEGTCLDSTTSLEILNSSTSEKTPLNILSKTGTFLKTKLSSSLTMGAGVVYKLVVSTASAQVVAPISLQIGSSLAVYSNGAKVGGFLTTAYAMYMGSGILVTNSNGQMGAYFSRNYPDSTGASVVPGTFYLYNSLFEFNKIFQNLTPNDLLTSNVITPSTSSVYGVYFTGADCTGDLVIGTSNQNIIKGNFIILPTGCVYTTGTTCTGHTPKKITSAGTFQSGVSVQSKIYIDGMSSSSDNIYCQSYPYTVDGYQIPAANITNLDSNDLPPVLTGVTISQ